SHHTQTCTNPLISEYSAPARRKSSGRDSFNEQLTEEKAVSTFQRFEPIMNRKSDFRSRSNPTI
ncbi:hypothetical protein MKW98_031667, partial [Papaver atlanticum]